MELPATDGCYELVPLSPGLNESGAIGGSEWPLRSGMWIAACVPEGYGTTQLAEAAGQACICMWHYCICIQFVFFPIFFGDDASKKSENGKSLENLRFENTGLLR